MATILDVAREAKVAASTVSLVLHHRDRVSPPTRQRVETVIRKLNFRARPRRTRRGPAKAQRIRALFLYTPAATGDSVMSHYCRELIHGVEQALADSNSTLNVHRGADHIDQDPMFSQQMDAREFDGVILFKPTPDDGYLPRLQASDVPLVALNRLPEHGMFSCVTLDYFGGGVQAVEHLVALGHRRIAIFPGHQDESKWLVKEYHAGAAHALADHRLVPVPVSRRVGSISDEQIERFCREARDGGATAMIGPDTFLVRCAEVLAGQDVRVPQQMSLMGFDDLKLTTRDGLALTSIGFDKQRMGRLAVRILQQLLHAEGKLRWLAGAVTTHLAQGQTTCPPD